jgi:hypothetical protein
MQACMFTNEHDARRCQSAPTRRPAPRRAREGAAAGGGARKEGACDRHRQRDHLRHDQCGGARPRVSPTPSPYHDLQDHPPSDQCRGAHTRTSARACRSLVPAVNVSPSTIIGQCAAIIAESSTWTSTPHAAACSVPCPALASPQVRFCSVCAARALTPRCARRWASRR